MNDQRNKNYDAFFQPDSQHTNRSEDGNAEENGPAASQPEAHANPSHYYSYGPYRSQTDGSGQSLQQHDLTTAQGSQTAGHAESVYPSAHWPEAKAPVAAGSPYSHEQPPWNYQHKRKRGWLTAFFAAFLCCALIMTSLAYASDVHNWFTGGGALTSGANAGRTSAGHSAPPNSSSAETVAVRESVGLPGSIADIVEQSSPAVVLVETYVSSNRGLRSRNNMDFFEYFFGDRIQVQPDTGGNMINSGLGSGFIFDKDGYILTNEHVVGGADEIYVTVEGYTEPFKAELLGSDFDLDLAVLKISGQRDFPTLPIGDSSKLRVGEWVTAIGNPLGYDHTVSVGVVSAKGRDDIRIPEGNRTRNYEDLLQTDASINPGNSGGPLLNMQGEVIGINTAVSADAQGIGFAIPSTTFVSIMDLLKNNESIPKPYIGVGISNIEESWLEDLKLDSVSGALITQVESGSPAARAGIQTWDVITKINDNPVNNYEDVKKYVAELGVGARVTITAKRDGQEIQFGVIIGNRNS